MFQVSSRLFEIQRAFISLLGDNNDLVQDAASKGVAIVYEACGENQREEMVSNLLDTLLGKKQSEVKKVNEDTKVFQEGELGKMPEGGGNLSTYKELCSLATDMGQPDLVYKFMHLANYNATWNSKKGAAFGFSSIAEKAGDQLAPHLPKIIPKLYRYQYDPTPRIQQSMSAIWSALVPETTKTVDKFLAEILAELGREMTSSQWRVRESCCSALTDLLRGRTLESHLDSLATLWTDLFRVMDDIKESVRVAAGKTAQALSRLSIKMTDSTAGSSKSGQAVKAILPALLERGLASSVVEVRSISLATIMKVTRSAGVLLAPHLHVLIPALLEAGGEMEASQLNYLSTRLGGEEVQERLDTARMTASKTSATMECVNFVLQYVDTGVLSLLVPRLVDIIKSNPSIVSKAGAAHVVTSLTSQCPLDLQAFTGKLLSAFLAGLSDRNPAVRLTYAGCIGHLVRTAKDSSREKLFTKLKTWYMDKEDESSRAAVAFTYQAVTRHNPDVMKSFASSALPISFLAMHQEKTASSSEILEVWEEVWLEGTPGTEAGIRLYLTELMELLPVALTSQQWPVKAQAARAMGTVATKLAANIQPETQAKLVSLLLSGLEGRTWAGKEELLKSLANIVKSAPETLRTNMVEKEKDRLVEAMLRECRKEKVEYKVIALESTGRVLRELKVDRLKEIYEIVGVYLPSSEKKEGGEDKEEEDEEDKESAGRKLEVEHGVLVCLGLAWPDCRATAELYLVTVLDHLENLATNTTRRNQLALIKCLGNILTVWSVPEDSDLTSSLLVFTRLAAILSCLLQIPKYVQLRTESLQVLGQTVQLLAQAGRAELVETFRTEVTNSLDGVIKDLGSDPATKTTARDLKTALNNLEGTKERSDQD